MLSVVQENTGPKIGPTLRSLLTESIDGFEKWAVRRSIPVQEILGYQLQKNGLSFDVRRLASRTESLFTRLGVHFSSEGRHRRARLSSTRARGKHGT